MNIVIDSNIICADFQLAGSSFRVLFDSTQQIGLRLYIPQLVIDEVNNKHAECLWANKAKMDRLILDVKRVTGEGIANNISDDFVQKRIGSYNQMLKDKLHRLEVVILKYPTISHEDLAQRAMLKRKPFSESGKGYRDTLIWENIIGLMKDKDEPVYFITANSHDFCDKEFILHPDLIIDLEKRGLNAKNITLFDNLDKFINEHIKPNLEYLETIKAQLSSGKQPGINLEEIVSEQISESLKGTSVDSDELGFPSEFENPSISAVEDVYNVEVLDVCKLPSGEIFVETEIDAECEFDFFIFKSDFYVMSEENIPFIWDYDWNDHYVAASRSAQIHIIFYLTFDSKVEKVTSFEIGEISGVSRTE